MPKLSRYTDKQIEDLLSELIVVLEKHQASVDLSLSVLGNMVTHLINSNIAPAQRYAIANSFADALRNSVHIDNSH